MSTQVQYRRGTATENNAFTGALAEITVDTTNWTLRVHDGLTAGGGGNIATVAYVSAQLAALSANAITFGTSNVQIPSSGSNVRVNVGGTSNVAVFSTAGANITGTLGVTGNITGSYILGNGSQLTGIDATSIQSGTSNVRVTTSGGNVAVSIGGTSNIAVFASTGQFVTGVVSASGNVTGGNVITGGLITATGAITGAAISGTTISGSGNVTGANITTAGLVSATGNLNTSSGVLATGNVTGGNLNITGGIFDSGIMTLTTAASGAIALAPNGSNVAVVSTTGVAVTGTMSASGSVTGAGVVSTSTITTAGNITTSGANGVANIGAVGAFFNTVHARATSAQYADVAEYYTSDANYDPGTVVVFGGSAEVTVSSKPADDTVAGVVSTNPAYIMNAGIQSQQSVAVALTGRVPTKVVGPVRKGNMMVSAANGYAQACATPAVGTVIGKAIENFDGERGIIEIVVGRV